MTEETLNSGASSCYYLHLAPKTTIFFLFPYNSLFDALAIPVLFRSGRFVKKSAAALIAKKQGLSQISPDEPV